MTRYDLWVEAILYQMTVDTTRPESGTLAQRLEGVLRNFRDTEVRLYPVHCREGRERSVVQVACLKCKRWNTLTDGVVRCKCGTVEYGRAEFRKPGYRVDGGKVVEQKWQA